MEIIFEAKVFYIINGLEKQLVIETLHTCLNDEVLLDI